MLSGTVIGSVLWLFYSESPVAGGGVSDIDDSDLDPMCKRR